MRYLDNQVVLTRNGTQEATADVTFPEAPPSLPSRQCPPCTRRFHNVQGLRVHQRVHHSNPDMGSGARLRRTLVSSCITTVPLPWDGNPIGRWWRARLHCKTTGVDPTSRVTSTVAFKLQLMSKGDQGIIADDFTPEPIKEKPGDCEAASHRSYTTWEKDSAIMQPREPESRSLEV